MNDFKKSNKFDIYQLIELTQKVNYLFYFLLGSILFWLLNLPFLFTLLIYDLRLTTLPIFLLSAIPVGPVFQGLLIAMHKIESGKVVRSFFIGLQNNWKNSLIIWLAFLIIIGLSGANLLLINLMKEMLPLKWVLLFVMVICGAFIINYYLLTTYYPELSLKNGIITTLQLSIMKSGRYGVSFIMVLSISIIMSQFPIYLFFFGIGLLAWLLDLNFKKIVEFIELTTIK